MKKALLLAAVCLGLSACEPEQNAERDQALRTNEALSEMNRQIGLPNIRNFQEKKLLKMVLEERDRENLVCYAYIIPDQTGKPVYIGRCIGYGIPYSTQYTNPQKVLHEMSSSPSTVPQADPNGLYAPGASEATWLFLIDPATNKPRPVYCEARTLVSPFPITIK